MSAAIFNDLFVLELANNHWGKLDRGLKIVSDFARVVRFNDVHAAIKLQFRDVDSFVHPDYRTRSDIRYIKKTLDTKLHWDELRQLVEAVRNAGMVKCSRAARHRQPRLRVRSRTPIASHPSRGWIAKRA